ncbi:MAG: family 78 glycoside hydrolase catalytic domain [Clostridia bacterium]|nr:family 78 glycoside hydrolase catalytic domain [Clostridia bacterium]
MDLEIEFTDGSCTHIKSDSSWSVADGPIIYNETRRGEIYDARLETDGFFDADFNDSHLNKAFICRSPGGIMKKTSIPPIKVIKEIKPTKISDNVYDLGQNISGWVKIIVKGTPGTEITLRYSELLHSDGSINPEELNTILGSQTHCDKYILKGGCTETFAPHFAYHGFRYVEVTNTPENFEIIGQVVHTDLEIIGDFECSDEMLNKIHSACRWSTLTNMQGFPTDCPQREQNAWTGDALLSADQTLMNYDAVEIYRKWLGDIRDSQRPSGQISCIAPTGGWGYNWGTGPAWDSVLIHLPYLVYKYCGNTDLIKENWNSMKLHMNFMDSMSDNNILNYGLGDWLAPDGTDVCPNNITDTCYYCSDYIIMAECAEIMNEDSEPYLLKAAEIKTAFRDIFLKDDFYLKNRQTALAAAIYFDMYTEAEKEKALDRLVYIIRNNNCSFDTGILGTKYLFTVLSENGHCDLMYDMVTNPNMPSYAYWILNGMTTLCEYWDMSHSCNHHMYSEVDMWMYKYIAGIRLENNKICIRPCFIPQVKWVKARHKNISVCYDMNKIDINTDSPVIFINPENNEKIHLSAGKHIIPIHR